MPVDGHRLGGEGIVVVRLPLGPRRVGEQRDEVDFAFSAAAPRLLRKMAAAPATSTSTARTSRSRVRDMGVSCRRAKRRAGGDPGRPPRRVMTAAYSTTIPRGATRRARAFEPHDVRRLELLQRVARVDHERCLPHNPRVVEDLVVRRDHGAVEAGGEGLVDGDGRELEPVLRHLGHVRIAVADNSRPCAGAASPRRGPATPAVVDVGLVGDAEEVDARAAQRLRDAVQRVDGALDHVAGHPAVDVAGQLDEPALEARLAGLPAQIERVDRDAVPASPGPG